MFMHVFDYSFLKDVPFSSDMITKVSRIESLRMRASYVIREHPDVMRDMEAVAKVMSVRGSNAIEGIVTTDDRIIALANGSVAPKGHSESEIAGYRDALAIVHAPFDSLEIEEKTILRLFSVMMRNPTGRPVTRHATMQSWMWIRTGHAGSDSFPPLPQRCLRRWSS